MLLNFILDQQKKKKKNVFIKAYIKIKEYLQVYYSIPKIHSF